MFNLSEIKVLTRQLTEDIASTQTKIDQTAVDAAEHVVLENRMIVLVGIKRKLKLKLDKESQRIKEQKKRLSVLIVDDSEAIREVFKAYFQELGFEDITLAVDGMDAWRKLLLQHEKNKPYGLIISDWNMPNMSGVELLQNVRANQNIGHTPLYLVTTNCDKSCILDAIQKGVSGYLIKPVNYNHIQDKFAKYLK